MRRGLALGVLEPPRPAALVRLGLTAETSARPGLRLGRKGRILPRLWFRGYCTPLGDLGLRRRVRLGATEAHHSCDRGAVGPWAGAIEAHACDTIVLSLSSTLAVHYPVGGLRLPCCAATVRLSPRTPPEFLHVGCAS